MRKATETQRQKKYSSCYLFLGLAHLLGQQNPTEFLDVLCIKKSGKIALGSLSLNMYLVSLKMRFLPIYNQYKTNVL